jgi:hypothetical protein
MLCLGTLTTGPALADTSEQEQMKTSSVASSRPPELTLDLFLDRVMMAESGGDDQARSKTSTALGPFQFIRSTFLSLVRRHFAEEARSLTIPAILALRTKRTFARRAAQAFTQDNANHLARKGLSTSFVNLRLAYLVGPTGAVRVLRSPPLTRLKKVLSSSAIKANPFMAKMTVADLIAKCARDLSVSPKNTAGLSPEREIEAAKPRKPPRIAVKCSLNRPSCRRWLSLAEARLDRKERKRTSQSDASPP